jgi:predicted dehydrogenase
MTPRLGFLGVGWIGRNRLEAIGASGIAEVVAVADVDPGAAAAAASPYGAQVVTPDEVLSGAPGLDGVVIATPSALHAEQAVRAICSGLAVFCQKPLGRTAGECAAVVDAAQRSDLLLGVDLSYRHLAGVVAMRQALPAIGDVYAADLVFHNAYGPDKAWFTDPELSGGGCVIDLGIHLVDLALWLLDGPKVEGVEARLFAKGRRVEPDEPVVEDYATALLDLSTGASISLSSSWFLHAGVDAEISATFHGTDGSVALHNVEGSFYDFRAVLRQGTSEQVLVEPPDAWGGRAAVAWARQLADGTGFDPACASVVEVARVLDRMYGR